MFFSAVIGPQADEARWRRVMAQHAAWLDLRVDIERHVLPGGRAICLGRMRREGCARGLHVAILDAVLADNASCSFSAEEVLDEMLQDSEHNSIRLFFDRSTGDVTAVIPPATPEPLYVWQTRCALTLADDLRVMARLSGMELDPAAVHTLFEYGVVPAPLALFKGVWRCPSGSIVRFDCASGGRSVEPIVVSRERPMRGIDGDDGGTWLEDTLERTLAAVPRNALLYFSGGVDSSVLAVQLRHIGRSDVSLVNFSFGPDDREADLASRVASAIGLPMRCVFQREEDTAIVLDRIGRDYSFPFSDASTLPTNVLAHASLETADRPSAVIEGTGADGAFAVPCRAEVWRRLYGVPRLLRSFGGASYRQFRLWKSPSRLARLSEAMRQSVQLRAAHAAVAQNGLDDIAYGASIATRALIDVSLGDFIDERLPGAAEPERLAMLDQVLVCGGAMAAKTFDPLRFAGVLPIYPYLSPAVVYGASLLPVESKCPAGEPKAILKSMLARDLEESLVYRPKSWFTPPLRRMFAGDVLQHVLRADVLSHDNDLLEFCDERAVRSMVEAAARGRLATSACDFLWTLAFSTSWLKQIRRAPGVHNDSSPVSDSVCAASLVS